MEDYYKNEQARLTLAIAFIATYLTIIVGFSDQISIKQANSLNVALYGIFITNGILVSLAFFLYLCFTALKLTSDVKKEIIFKQEISPVKLQNIRKKLFGTGVKLIFSSFVYPAWYVYTLLEHIFGTTISLILFIIFILIIQFIAQRTFSDTKKSPLEKS